MIIQKKTRADAKLKTLPLSKQIEIADMLRTKRLEDVQMDLLRQGIKTSQQALSIFNSWYQLRQSALGAQIVELSAELHQFSRRLSRRDYAVERLADQARSTCAILRDDALSDGAVRARLKRLFKIK